TASRCPPRCRRSTLPVREPRRFPHSTTRDSASVPPLSDARLSVCHTLKYSLNTERPRQMAPSPLRLGWANRNGHLTGTPRHAKRVDRSGTSLYTQEPGHLENVVRSRRRRTSGLPAARPHDTEPIVPGSLPPLPVHLEGPQGNL